MKVTLGLDVVWIYFTRIDLNMVMDGTFVFRCSSRFKTTKKKKKERKTKFYGFVSVFVVSLMAVLSPLRPDVLGVLWWERDV